MIKLQVLMQYRIPFNFVFQLFIQSDFSQNFIQVKNVETRQFFFVTVHYIPNLMKILWVVH